MKRLYKSRKDRVIAGVCGGVGEYFEIDPVLIRIIWALLAILGGSGIIAYIIGMIIIPERPKEDIPDDFEVEEERKNNRKTSQTVWGIILIGIGLIVLFQQFPLFGFFSSKFWYVSWGIIFPVFLIILGGIILFKKSDWKVRSDESGSKIKGEKVSAKERLTVLRNERKIAGVSAGMAYYLNIDPTIIRLLWVVGVFATGGVALLIYVILAIVLPESDETFADLEAESGEPTTDTGS
jgi:phage shock protein C